ncbi:MAG: hypothetical protein KJ621_09735 [Proteobacteria bacterium]|nr:hypothetical protein [Pseudomonadota bacterium]MBU1740497.1 hypothetical protein [Pseudomonadota bacterium]
MPPKKVYKRISNNEWAQIGRYVQNHPEESLNHIAQRFKVRPSTLRSKSQRQGWRTKKTTDSENDAENITAENITENITDEFVGENITQKFVSENITDEIAGTRIKPDWPHIKAWYVTHPKASFRITARRYGVSESTLTKRAIAEGWAGLRERKQKENEAKVQQLAEQIITAKVVEDRTLEIVTTEILVNEARRVALNALKDAQGSQRMWAALQAAIVAKVSQQALALTLNRPRSQASSIDLLSIQQVAADHPARQNPTGSPDRTPHLKILEKTRHPQSLDPRAA